MARGGTIARAGNVVGRGAGPSGKPLLHFPKFKSRKEAFEAAKLAGKGSVDPLISIKFFS